ncbi:MAG: DMT family transporter [Alphaproteobacteria bacterium]
MAAATLCFVAMQAMAKHVGKELHPFEVAFFRNLFGLVALAPLFLRQGLAPLRTERIGLHAFRGGLQSVGMLCFFTGVTMIPLSTVTALSFTAPLVGSLLAVLILGEIVRARRITALVIGFVGVIVVLRPGFAEISTGALLILASTISWGSTMVVIKVLSRTESSATQTAYMGLFLTPITLVPALFVWEWPTLEQYGWFLLIGIAGTLGHLAFAQAFRQADATAVLPLDFLRLIWATLVGWLIFSELPDLWAWIGGTVIFASATYIAYRESKVAREKRRNEERETAPGPPTVPPEDAPPPRP